MSKTFFIIRVSSRVFCSQLHSLQEKKQSAAVLPLRKDYRTLHVQATVVVNKARLLELVREEIAA
jgi:hypothetical protein